MSAESSGEHQRAEAWKSLALITRVMAMVYSHGGEPTEATLRAFNEAQDRVDVIEPPSRDDLEELKRRLVGLRHAAIIEAEEPPQRNGQGRRYNRVRVKLIENSGRWARIADYKTIQSAQSAATKVRRSEGAWAGHQWEAEARLVDGVANLYVRHIRANSP